MEKSKVLVVGCNGRMGKLVCEAISNSKDFAVSAGYDVEEHDGDFPIFTSVEKLEKYCFNGRYDLIIDFSRPAATMDVLENFAVKNHVPMVIATTGFSADEEDRIDTASQYVPIFKSSNMSYGVNAMLQLLKIATMLFPDYDYGISEFHHGGKKDAPSGTAKMFFEAINDAHGSNLTSVYGSTDKKNPNEVWIASQRGGAFPGEHVVTFAGANDFIRIEHFAHNPSIFAEGALDAARYLLKQKIHSLYNMEDMILAGSPNS